MSNFIGISIEGLEEAFEAIAAVEARALNLQPVALGTQLIVIADVDERFNSAPGTESGGNVYGGETWAPLTEAYLTARDRYRAPYEDRVIPRRGGQLLRDSGELLQSFQVGGAGHIFESDAQSVTVGSNLPKAAGLQNKRPMLFVHPDLVQTVEAYWANYVVNGAT